MGTCWQAAWILTRQQLLRLGFSSRSIEHRRTTGRLHLVTRGVYAVGWPALEQRRRWMAAVLACGEDAALSHRSAAALLGIGRELPGRIDISVPRRCELRRPGLLIRGRPSLGAADFSSREDIPVTSPVRTLIDLTTELDIAAVERAINDADKRSLIDPESLRHALDRYHRTPSAQARDARRDRAHVLAGMTPLRFTHYEVRYERRLVRQALIGAVSMLRQRIRD